MEKDCAGRLGKECPRTNKHFLPARLGCSDGHGQRALPAVVAAVSSPPPAPHFGHAAGACLCTHRRWSSGDGGAAPPPSPSSTEAVPASGCMTAPAEAAAVEAAAAAPVRRGDAVAAGADAAAAAGGAPGGADDGGGRPSAAGDAPPLPPPPAAPAADADGEWRPWAGGAPLGRPPPPRGVDRAAGADGVGRRGTPLLLGAPVLWAPLAPPPPVVARDPLLADGRRGGGPRSGRGGPRCGASTGAAGSASIRGSTRRSSRRAPAGVRRAATACRRPTRPTRRTCCVGAAAPPRQPRCAAPTGVTGWAPRTWAQRPRRASTWCDCRGAPGGSAPPRARGGRHGRPAAAVDPSVGRVAAHLGGAAGWAAAAWLAPRLDVDAHRGGPRGEATAGRARGRAWAADGWDGATARGRGRGAGRPVRRRRRRRRRRRVVVVGGDAARAAGACRWSMSPTGPPRPTGCSRVPAACPRRLRVGGLRAEAVAVVVDRSPSLARPAGGERVRGARHGPARGHPFVLDGDAYLCFGEGVGRRVCRRQSPPVGARRGRRRRPRRGGAGGWPGRGRPHAQPVRGWRARGAAACRGRGRRRGAGAGCRAVAHRRRRRGGAGGWRGAGARRGRGGRGGLVSLWTWQVDACDAERWWDYRECLRRGLLDRAWWAPDAGWG